MGQAFKGRDALLQAAVITSGVVGTFRSVGGVQSYSFSESRELPEVSDLIKQTYPVTPDIDDESFNNEVLPYESYTVDCTGVYKDSFGEQILRGADGSGCIIQIKFTFPDLATIEGPAYVSSISSDNSHNTAMSFSASFVFVGEVTKTGI